MPTNYIVDYFARTIGIHREVSFDLCKDYHLEPYAPVDETTTPIVSSLVDVAKEDLVDLIGTGLMEKNNELREFERSHDFFFYKKKLPNLNNCLVANYDPSTEKNTVCGICMDKDLTESLSKTTCSHHYHKSCLEKWVKACVANCPLCRHEFWKN